MILRRRSTCSIRTVFNAVGREPLSSNSRWYSRRIGLSSAYASSSHFPAARSDIPVSRRCSLFQSTAVTGLTGGRSGFDR
ncbi:hypothetical protein [Caulobacter sp. S45]|uniref:hypothetical protein n=1 Tax=Caulobacter sp. S45 TaxID=1641861 RepID=UPI00352A5156